MEITEFSVIQTEVTKTEVTKTEDTRVLWYSCDREFIDEYLAEGRSRHQLIIDQLNLTNTFAIQWPKSATKGVVEFAKAFDKETMSSQFREERITLTKEDLQNAFKLPSGEFSAYKRKWYATNCEQMFSTQRARGNPYSINDLIEPYSDWADVIRVVLMLIGGKSKPTQVVGRHMWYFYAHLIQNLPQKRLKKRSKPTLMPDWADLVYDELGKELSRVRNVLLEMGGANSAKWPTFCGTAVTHLLMCKGYSWESINGVDNSCMVTPKDLEGLGFLARAALLEIKGAGVLGGAALLEIINGLENEGTAIPGGEVELLAITNGRANVDSVQNLSDNDECTTNYSQDDSPSDCLGGCINDVGNLDATCEENNDNTGPYHAALGAAKQPVLGSQEMQLQVTGFQQWLDVRGISTVLQSLHSDIRNLGIPTIHQRMLVSSLTSVWETLQRRIAYLEMENKSLHDKLARYQSSNEWITTKFTEVERYCFDLCDRLTRSIDGLDHRFSDAESSWNETLLTHKKTISEEKECLASELKASRKQNQHDNAANLSLQAELEGKVSLLTADTGRLNGEPVVVRKQNEHHKSESERRSDIQSQLEDTLRKLAVENERLDHDLTVLGEENDHDKDLSERLHNDRESELRSAREEAILWRERHAALEAGALKYTEELVGTRNEVISAREEAISLREQNAALETTAFKYTEELACTRNEMSSAREWATKQRALNGELEKELAGVRGDNRFIAKEVVRLRKLTAKLETELAEAKSEGKREMVSTSVGENAGPAILGNDTLHAQFNASKPGTISLAEARRIESATDAQATLLGEESTLMECQNKNVGRVEPNTRGERDTQAADEVAATSTPTKKRRIDYPCGDLQALHEGREPDSSEHSIRQVAPILVEQEALREGGEPDSPDVQIIEGSGAKPRKRMRSDAPTRNAGANPRKRMRSDAPTCNPDIPMNECVVQNDILTNQHGGYSDKVGRPKWQVPDYCYKWVDIERIEQRTLVDDTELEGKTTIPTEMTRGIDLYEHQAKGVCWMLSMEHGEDEEEYPMGGILADDQGMGKTIQLIGLMLLHRRKGCPTLIVCPASVLFQWEQETREKVSEKFKLNVLIYHGDDRFKHDKVLGTWDVVITTYTLATTVPGGKVRNPIHECEWGRIILDECQNIKTNTGKAATQICKLKARYRWCVSGTVLSNHYTELYSYFKFLNYSPLGHPSFATAHRKKMATLANAGNTCSIWNDMSSHLVKMTLRREKSILNLPKKISQTIEVEFIRTEDKTLYKTLDNKCHLKFQDAGKDKKKRGREILTLMLKLRQVCLHRNLALRQQTQVEDTASTTKVALEPFEKAVCADALYGYEVEGRCIECEETWPIGGPSHVNACCQCLFCGECALNVRDGSANQRCPALDCGKQMNWTTLYSVWDILPDGYDQQVDEDALSLLGFEFDGDAPKFGHVMEYLHGLPVIGEDRSGKPITEKALIFSQWPSVFPYLQKMLEFEQFQYRVLEGRMGLVARRKALSEFKSDPQVKVMLLSLHAANAGLNITAANHVLFIDHWWNPAIEDQAVDRTHRLGQKRDVHVVHFVVRNTIKMTIIKRQDFKRRMARGCLYGTDELGEPVPTEAHTEFGDLYEVWQMYREDQG